MYCIDKEGTIFNNIPSATTTQTTKTVSSVNDNDANVKQMTIFSKQVIEKMALDNIPATPENYAIYFDKLLENKAPRQKQNIQKILATETIEDNIYVAQVENNIKESFKQIKTILETVSNMYNKITKLKTLTKLKREELHNGSGKIALVSYDELLEDIVKTLEKQQKTIKDKYGDISENIKLFQANTIFDTKYDVYNKNFLFRVIESEKKNIAAFGYESSLIAFKIASSSFVNIRLQRDKDLVIKNIATMILKRSRRSDIVAHLDHDTFIIVLKHTNLSQAEQVIHNIDQMINNTNYIIDSHHIDVSLEYALGKIVAHQTKDQILSSLINQLY